MAFKNIIVIIKKFKNLRKIQQKIIVMYFFFLNCFSRQKFILYFFKFKNKLFLFCCCSIGLLFFVHQISTPSNKFELCCNGSVFEKSSKVQFNINMLPSILANKFEFLSLKILFLLLKILN